jgi:hypothetical protein
MKSFLVGLLLAVPGCLLAQSNEAPMHLWDAARLANVKTSVQKPEYVKAYNALISKAEKALNAHYATVMDKEKIPPSGNKHDYTSLAIYYWPNPATKDGLPYVSKDGQRNPELKKFDAEPKSAMIDGVLTLTLAGYFSGDKKYSAAAARLLDDWFLNPATRMNPNLNYAQHIPGVCDGRGIGIIDTYNFVSLTDAITLLNGSGELTPAQFQGLKKWFSDFAAWLMESKNGRDESVTRNNHGTAYDVQLTSCLLFAGKTEEAKKIMSEFMQRRVFKQIEPDGSQPLELSRTLSFHYSWYNLTHIIDMAAIARPYGIDVLGTVSPDGRSVDKAVKFLTAYIGRQSEWKWQQIHDYDEVEKELCQELRKMASITGNLSYEKLRQELNRMAPGDLTLLLFAL